MLAWYTVTSAYNSSQLTHTFRQNKYLTIYFSIPQNDPCENKVLFTFLTRCAECSEKRRVLFPIHCFPALLDYPFPGKDQGYWLCKTQGTFEFHRTSEIWGKLRSFLFRSLFLCTKAQWPGRQCKTCVQPKGNARSCPNCFYYCFCCINTCSPPRPVACGTDF